MTTTFDFLVIGAGRGGTSLLAGLLDSHPLLEVGFELHSIDTLMGRDINQETRHLFHERVSSFIRLCDESASLSTKKYWGNKITTEQIAGLEDHNNTNTDGKIDIFDTLFNQYLHDKKILFILRDGRSCVNSKVRRTNQSMDTACKRWLYAVECYRFLREKHNNNLCIRFEDLLLNPEHTLTSACKFLDVDYSPIMLNGVSNKKMLPEYQNTGLIRSKAAARELEDKFFIKIQQALVYCNYI